MPALLGVIVLFALVARFSPKELAPFFVSAFEKKLQLNTYLVLVLREYIAATGLLGELPAMLSALPLPPALVFALKKNISETLQKLLTGFAAEPADWMYGTQVCRYYPEFSTAHGVYDMAANMEANGFPWDAVESALEQLFE